MGSRTLTATRVTSPGRKKGQSLGAKDMDVLRRIAQKGFQSYPALRSTLLSKMNRQHSWWFMKRLVKLGYLVESKGDQGGILGWSLSRVARKNLFLTEEESLRTDCSAPRYRGSFVHDEIVREIEDVLRASPLITKWIPEHVLRKEAMSRIRYFNSEEQRSTLAKIPDAVFEIELQKNRRRIALELELARKTKKRVFERIEAHIIHPGMDSVLFVASDEQHLRFLWSVYEAVLSHSFRVKLHRNPNGIYFSTLENLRKHRLQAIFCGRDGSFSFESLRQKTPIISSDTVG